MKIALNNNEFLRDKFTPYPENQMDLGKYMPGTICGVLREIYQKSADDEIKLLARLATSMAKRMSAKLHEYHNAQG